MMWSNAYSSAPVCSPTRVAFLTGKNQARVGFTGHITNIRRHRYPENSRIIPPDDYMNLSHDEIILPEVLKPAGYTSINIGKWHVGVEGHWPTDMGFDYNIAGHTSGAPPSHFYPYENPESSHNTRIPSMIEGKPGEYLTDRLTDEAPQELIDKYKPIVKNSDLDPVYAAMVESVDWNLGRLLQALDDLDLTENTVVIFASDNGAITDWRDGRPLSVSPFREERGHLYEGGLRVPLIIRWPGHIKPGTVSENPTISEDIYATIVDIVGEKANPNSPLDGRSLVNDFDSDDYYDDIVLHWYYPHYSPRVNLPGAAIRSGDYKLIEFYDPQKVELYNLKEDIEEKYDLSEQLPEKKKELLDKIQSWLTNISPILHTINSDHDPNLDE